MKKTLDVLLEHESKVIFLMKQIGFIEVERFATGGLHSSPSVLITFEGKEDDYHEKGYIIHKTNNEWIPAYYYTIKNPNGTHFNTFEEFEADMKKEFTFNYHELS